MIEEATAIRVAVGLVRVPSRVRRVRGQPLPAGVTWLLRIAAGDQDAQREAAESTAEPPAVLHEAAAFFIEQIMLSPDSDSYRVLGTSAQATPAELRRNMGLLLKGMHPDVEDGARSLFAHRVTHAWDTIKTPERRAAYDAALRRSSRNGPAKKNRLRDSSRQHRFKRLSKNLITEGAGNAPEGWLHRVLRLLLAGVRA